MKPSSDTSKKSSGKQRGDQAQQSLFPVRLFAMLEQVEAAGMTHIVGWQPHGRSFLVRNRELFVNAILPKFFKQSRFSSFQRQVNIYGFQRITKGPDAGAYYHDQFQRNRSDLLPQIDRIQCKGVGKGRHRRPVELEPNFYTAECRPAPEAQDSSNSLTSCGSLQFSPAQFLQEVRSNAGWSSAESWSNLQQETAETTIVTGSSSSNASFDKGAQGHQNNGMPKNSSVAAAAPWSNVMQQKQGSSLTEQNMAMFNMMQMMQNQQQSSTSCNSNIGMREPINMSAVIDNVVRVTPGSTSSSSSGDQQRQNGGMTQPSMMMNGGQAHATGTKVSNSLSPQNQQHAALLNLLNQAGGDVLKNLTGQLQQQQPPQQQQQQAMAPQQKFQWNNTGSPSNTMMAPASAQPLPPSAQAALAALLSGMGQQHQQQGNQGYPQQQQNMGGFQQQQQQQQQIGNHGFQISLPSELEPRHFA